MTSLVMKPNPNAMAQNAASTSASDVDDRGRVRRLLWLTAPRLSDTQKHIVARQLLENTLRRMFYWFTALFVCAAAVTSIGLRVGTPPSWYLPLDAWFVGFFVLAAGFAYLFYKITLLSEDAMPSTVAKWDWALLVWILVTFSWWSLATLGLEPQPWGLRPPQFEVGQRWFVFLTMTFHIVTLICMSASWKANIGVTIILFALYWIALGIDVLSTPLRYFAWWSSAQIIAYGVMGWVVAKSQLYLTARAVLLAEAGRIAKDAIDNKNQFLSAISHDLRQPLTTLSLTLHALADRIPHDEALRAYVNTAQRETVAMEDMVSGAFDLARLESGTWTVDVKEVLLPSIIKDVVDSLQPEASAKRIRLSVHTLPFIVRTDRHALRRIVFNLTMNAIRYTPEGGRVLVGCRRRGDLLKIGVWDNGIGIPNELQKDIFREYYQVGNAERDSKKGFGLGLSIVQGLATLLHHKSDVNSIVGKGSVFSIYVPIVSRIPEELLGITAEQKVKSGDVDLKSMVIVVIEDHEALRGQMTELLNDWGCYVISGPTAADVIGTLEAEKLLDGPHFLLSDYQLPQGDGFRAIEEIRAVAGKDTPAALWSANTSSTFLKRAHASGLVVLSKPPSLPALLELLERHMPKAQDKQARRTPSAERAL